MRTAEAVRCFFFALACGQAGDSLGGDEGIIYAPAPNITGYWIRAEAISLVAQLHPDRHGGIRCSSLVIGPHRVLVIGEARDIIDQAHDTVIACERMRLQLMPP